MANDPQIYLIAEISSAAEVPPPGVEFAGIASVLFVARAGADLPVPVLKNAVSAAQAKGSAAMISDDAALVRILKADGVHLPWSKTIVERYQAARGELGQRYIIGADAGRSRHDAMLLGEAGADYVAFGIPDHVEDRDVARKRQLELVDWWSEIFEVPCVAFDVDDLEHARALADAGADFVTLRIAAGTSAEDQKDAVARLREALETGEAVG